uniref:Uncharacterized protein n=1 Tax=Rhizophora mucronata TaxID=61149 RepID=A0A2P2P4J8_RHIMU
MRKFGLRFSVSNMWFRSLFFSFYLLCNNACLCLLGEWDGCCNFQQYLNISHH